MKMLFYHPVPILQNASSASGIRPAKMIRAFRAAGFDVDEVCGYSAERKAAIIEVKKKISQGTKYDFAYGENTTLPFAMNDPSHFPRNPFLDYSFWIWLKKQKIPFGCFYRDVYWRFPELRKGQDFPKWALPLPFHYLDMLFLKMTCSKLFLPSSEYAKFLPFDFKEEQISTLPPGCEIEKNISKKNFSIVGNKLNLFYVGGVTPPIYDISPMLDFFNFQRGHNVGLTLCCRETEWKKLLERKIYGRFNLTSISIIHKKGKELNEYWTSASVFLALWQKNKYRDFAVPFKIFEVLGYGLPIITTFGTASGHFVEANNFGWAIEPTSHDLSILIKKLTAKPDLIQEKRESILANQKNYTWNARIQNVVDSLLRKE